MAERKNRLVMKFGGTSVGSREAVEHVLEIVRGAREEWEHVLVVSSAFSGVTNLLLESAKKAARGEVYTYQQATGDLLERHLEMLAAFVPEGAERGSAARELEELVEQFENLCQAISILGEATPRALDAVVSLGERMSVRVIAAALRSAEIPAHAMDATELVVTDDHFQAAIPDEPATRKLAQERLFPLLANGVVPIITGFIGANRQGVTTTLGRGGSDYSAALLGVAIDADEVWIWTDVDGVMTADPRLAKDAHTLQEVSYKEVAELAYFGAKVLHPKTIRPVIEANIKLRVLNTFNPTHPGTRLVPDREACALNGIIKAVTAIRGVQLITLEGRGMLGVPGVAARIFGAVAGTGATVPMITEASSEQSITFAVPVSYTDEVLAVLQKEMGEDLADRNIDRIWATEEVVIVTAVCPDMRQRLGVAGKIFGALAEVGVNVLAIAHGSSEVSISLVVRVEDLEQTVQALHALTIGQAQ
ncbi:MAG: aspartate kinase [Anaerolineaceae bacterium]|nr:aspartate kinase [Anaerolineaceae bacterium]